jgi:hypothetical protein
VAGILLTAFAHYSDRTYPLLALLTGPPTDQKPYPLRDLDPTCRLRGWQFLAAEVDRIRAETTDPEGEPIIAACSWTIPGELGVYCNGQPRVYSIGPIVGERHSQYDLWPNPVNDPQLFQGRTFIIVGGLKDEMYKAFDSVGPTRKVTYLERGQPITTWHVTVGRGFRSFPVKAEALAGNPRF